MFADTFHDTFAEAVTEASHRRADAKAVGFLTNVERSPYGGFRVRSIPAEFYVDDLIEMPIAGNAFRLPGPRFGV